MFRSYRDTVRTPVKTNKEKAKKYFCDLCENGETTTGWALELDVEIHRRRVHKMELMQLMKEPKNFMCSVCLRKQPDHASLISHIKRHHLLTTPDGHVIKREIFICDYCNNIFFNKLLLTAHIKNFHLLTMCQKRTATTVCPACDKNLNVRSVWFHFLNHGIIHTGTCPICLSTFGDYTEALKHIDNHPGYYSCHICPYEAKKANLFQNHVDKHRKKVNLEGKHDVKRVSKYFVPQKRSASWNRKFVNIFKGMTLAPELQICIMCRTLCETDEQMLQHIYGDHSPENVAEVKRHICACGEEFFNGVLLKHHIFTLKGEHKIADDTPTNKRRRIESPETKEPISDNTTDDDNDQTCTQSDQLSEPEEHILNVCIDTSNIVNNAMCTIKQENDSNISTGNVDHMYVNQATETNQSDTKPITRENMTNNESVEEQIYENKKCTSDKSSVIRRRNDSKRSTDQQMLYLTINHSNIEQSEKRIRKNTPHRPIILNKRNNVNRQVHLQNRMRYPSADIVDNSNETVFQICDVSGATISTVPELDHDDQYEEVISADQIVNCNSETDYACDQSEHVACEVLEATAESSEDPSRLIVEESILFS